MSKDLVIVESPTKAKTIASYLGGGLDVVASYGHIRDLPSKEGVVQPEKDFAMHWSVSNKDSKHLSAITKSVKGATNLYLATDPDREGEAIAWHLVEYLKQKNLTPPNIKRVVFNEITPKAIEEAFANPSNINQELVEAYLARRALDYLFGFTLSPILWRRLPGSKSAGRVQSAAVRLIADREAERLAFKTEPYWTITAKLEHGGKEFEAGLSTLNGAKVDKFHFKARSEAEQLITGLKTLEVVELESTTQNLAPPPPFTTSTLQQVASGRLGFGAAKTMRVAQQLYEGFSIGGKQQGLITYMRTDSVNIASTAITQCRNAIAKLAGNNFLPPTPHKYKSKAKNAQEAHEAIRPTNFSLHPDGLSNLPEDAKRLYRLIWQRAMASQTKQAVINRTAIIFKSQQATEFKANGSTIAFEGFLKFYPRPSPPKGKGEEDQLLPTLAKGEVLTAKEFEIGDHETKPPPRYTEASLVKTLEEKGIGRPSTYASIISTVQDRGYATLTKKQFAPTPLGMMAAAFFRRFFKPYVEYEFTAQMEDDLDKISNGSSNRLELLRKFWDGLTTIGNETKDVSMREVISVLEKECLNLIFPVPEGKTLEQVRTCPKCGKQLNLKIGKYGPFIGCSGYPECKQMSSLVGALGGGAFGGGSLDGPSGGKELGEALGGVVWVKNGPYGPYLQLDSKETETPSDATANTADTPVSKTTPKASKTAPKANKPKPPKTTKPKRVSIPKQLDPASITLETATKYLELPRKVGSHPDDNGDILAGIGRFGPYVVHNKKYASLQQGDEVLTVGTNRAVALLAEKKVSRFAPPKPLRTLEQAGVKIEVFDGKYGKYLKKLVNGKAVNATLPKGLDENQLTFAQCEEIVAKKLQAKKSRRK